MNEDSKNYFENLAGNEEGMDQAIENESIPVASLAKAENISIKKMKKADSELDFFSDDFISEAEGQLTVDVFQTKDEIIIQSTIAGVKEDDLEIDITGESVSIRGKRERSDEIKDEDFFYQECYWGRFSRSIILPQEINPDKAKASLESGVLTLRLPKLEREKSKKLRIKVN